MKTTPTKSLALELADAYADASFEQGLNQRTVDPAPEKAREALAREIYRLAAIEQEYERIRALEPVAQIKSSGQFEFPILEWLSADHSFRAPIGSLLVAIFPKDQP